MSDDPKTAHRDPSPPSQQAPQAVWWDHGWKRDAWPEGAPQGERKDWPKAGYKNSWYWPDQMLGDAGLFEVRVWRKAGQPLAIELDHYDFAEVAFVAPEAVVPFMIEVLQPLADSMARQAQVLLLYKAIRLTTAVIRHGQGESTVDATGELTRDEVANAVHHGRRRGQP